jgi:hypothetical protein
MPRRSLSAERIGGILCDRGETVGKPVLLAACRLRFGFCLRRIPGMDALRHEMTN